MLAAPNTKYLPEIKICLVISIFMPEMRMCQRGIVPLTHWDDLGNLDAKSVSEGRNFLSV